MCRNIDKKIENTKFNLELCTVVVLTLVSTLFYVEFHL